MRRYNHLCLNRFVISYYYSSMGLIKLLEIHRITVLLVCLLSYPFCIMLLYFVTAFFFLVQIICPKGLCYNLYKFVFSWHQPDLISLSRKSSVIIIRPNTCLGLGVISLHVVLLHQNFLLHFFAQLLFVKFFFA